MAIDVTPHDELAGADLHAAFRQSSSDPGAIGAGKGWQDTDDDALRIRNAADSGWIDLATGSVTLDYAEAGDLVAVAFGDTADAGVSTEVPRADHRHAAPANPVTAHTADADAHHARSHDHSAAGDGSSLVPGSFRFPQAASPSPTTEGNAIWDSDDDVLRVGNGASATVLGKLGSTVASTQAFGDAAAAGSSLEASRVDHKHAMPANPKLGHLVIPVGAMVSAITSGAGSPTQREAATNDQNIVTASFADGSTTYLHCAIAMPTDYDGGTFTAKFRWLAPGTSTNTVRWQIEARSYGDQETLDAVYGTAVAVDDAHTATADQVLLSAATSAHTPSGTPAGGEWMHFRIARLGGHANDNFAAAAELLAVEIFYTRT